MAAHAAARAAVVRPEPGEPITANGRSTGHRQCPRRCSSGWSVPASTRPSAGPVAGPSSAASRALSDAGSGAAHGRHGDEVERAAARTSVISASRRSAGPHHGA